MITLGHIAIGAGTCVIIGVGCRCLFGDTIGSIVGLPLYLFVGVITAKATREAPHA